MLETYLFNADALIRMHTYLLPEFDLFLSSLDDGTLHAGHLPGMCSSLERLLRTLPRILITGMERVEVLAAEAVLRDIIAAAAAAATALQPHAEASEQQCWEVLRVQGTSAFDALCDVGDLRHMAQGILQAERHYFRVPTYEDGYMDNVHWQAGSEFIQAAANASARYDLGVGRLFETVQDAEDFMVMALPDGHLVLSPAVMVASALDGLSSNALNYRKMREHPALDAQKKLQRRVNRVQHGIAVHEWLVTAPVSATAALPDGWLSHFTLSPLLLKEAPRALEIVGGDKIRSMPCKTVLVHPDDEEAIDPLYTEQPIKCDEPAAYLDPGVLPLLFGQEGDFPPARPCPYQIGNCGTRMK
jgi:hypothetical protein